MDLTLIAGLPFVSATVSYQSQTITMSNILVDTGSGGTVFAADQLLDVGVVPGLQDAIHRIAGVGGTEFVYGKKMDSIVVGSMAVNDFRIEVGALSYGFNINGILGSDFLMAVGAVINLRNLTISPAI